MRPPRGPPGPPSSAPLLPIGHPRAVPAVLTAALLAASPVHAQPRRVPAVQPAAEALRGDLLLGAGLGWHAGGDFPLSGLAGDLFVPARLSLAWAAADRLLFTLEGSVWQVLEVGERRPSAVTLDPGVADGTTGDAGDFRLGVLYLPLGAAQGPSAGFRLEVKLPNSDETKGIGTNTTDVRIGLLGSWGGGPLRLTADLGMAILEAPLENFEQNDVLAYAAEALFDVPGQRGRLSLGVEGRASTRGRVPLGTEDLGRVCLGGEVRLGPLVVDVALGAGYAGTSPDWELEVGAAWVRRQPRRPTARDPEPGVPP